jgi:chemotaxis protein methyltransferase CheR
MAKVKTENNDKPVFSHVKLSEKEFRNLGAFIHSQYGIKMPPSKKTMLEARLQKRIRALCMDSFAEYCEYVFSPEGIKEELVQMVDLVTTNKTDFFREPAHFSFLTEKALPELINAHEAGVKRPLVLWSAGCSTGEEPYTLAMVLSEFTERLGRFHFTILASDLSTKVLEKAQEGVYRDDRIGPIPQELRRKYLLRSKDRTRRLVRVVPDLRALVRFRRINFMEGDFGMREPMDIIFCRNVIIYFDRPTQEKLLNRLGRHLVPGGYLFMGHSETLNGLNVPFFPVAPTVYRKPL